MVTDTRREPGNKLYDTVYADGYDTGYKTALGDLGILYLDSPDEFYKALESFSQQSVQAETEEQPEDEPDTLKQHTRHSTGETVRWKQEYRDLMLNVLNANVGDTVDELFKPLEHRIPNLTMKSFVDQLLSMGIGTKKRVPYILHQHKLDYYKEHRVPMYIRSKK